MKCPKCGTECEPYAEVDIGVGVMQGGPWGCPACHWVEDDLALGLDQIEEDGPMDLEDQLTVALDRAFPSSARPKE